MVCETTGALRMTRILLCLSHSIEEANQVQMFHELGHEVASIGGFIDPAHPHDNKRPALPQVPMVPVVKEAVDSLGTADNLGAAQRHIPDPILDWLGDDGVIFYHHYLDRLFDQWSHIKDWMRGSPQRRVVWRSVGQSVEGNERIAQPFRKDGLERVAYSPKEANIPQYSGHDALIRFWADPDEWKGWTGDDARVINITQHLRQREPYTNWRFWEEATKGLPRMAIGPGSEAIQGAGAVSYDDMKAWLRQARCYLYCGTQPASYTLGLIEAMMTGIPVVSIGPSWMKIFPYGPDLFEGLDIALFNDPPSNGVVFSHTAYRSDYNDPVAARSYLDSLLSNRDYAQRESGRMRQRAIELFGKATIAEQWRAFLG